MYYQFLTISTPSTCSVGTKYSPYLICTPSPYQPLHPLLVHHPFAAHSLIKLTLTPEGCVQHLPFRPTGEHYEYGHIHEQTYKTFNNLLGTNTRPSFMCILNQLFFYYHMLFKGFVYPYWDLFLHQQPLVQNMISCEILTSLVKACKPYKQHCPLKTLETKLIVCTFTQTDRFSA